MGHFDMESCQMYGSPKPQVLDVPVLWLQARDNPMYTYEENVKGQASCQVF